jgi:hypothetical protein
MGVPGAMPNRSPTGLVNGQLTRQVAEPSTHVRRCFVRFDSNTRVLGG